MANPETNSIITLPFSQVHIDPTENARQFYDEGRMKELVASIRTNKLLQPPVIRPSVPEDKTTKPYTLTAGYRRMKALETLEYTEGPFVLTKSDKQEGVIINLIENFNREGITPYETAKSCVRLRDEFGMDGDEISKRLKGEGIEGKGKSKSNLNNLMRLYDKLHPDILEAWKARHEKATTFNLLSILGADEDQDAQLEAWEILTGVRSADKDEGGEDEGEEGEGGEGEGGKDAPKPKARKMMEIVAAMGAVRKAAKSAEISEDHAKTILMVLDWCANRRKTIAGIKEQKEESKE